MTTSWTGKRHIWRVRGRGLWASFIFRQSAAPVNMAALGRVVGNWCLDINNLTWVVWNLQKRFAKDLMLRRESLSNEVQRLTVGLKNVFSTKSSRQADRPTGWITETWHVWCLRLWSGTLTALANVQCINVSNPGNQTSYLALWCIFLTSLFQGQHILRNTTNT